MRGIVISIRRNESIEESKHKLISMLETLLSAKSPEQKKQKLVEEYGMRISAELERRLGTMCNMSDAMWHM